jgi:hypothetical protein
MAGSIPAPARLTSSYQSQEFLIVDIPALLLYTLNVRDSSFGFLATKGICQFICA